MTKSKTNKAAAKATKANRRLAVKPLPPVIYFNDGVSPDAPEPALALLELLPKCSYSAVTPSFGKNVAIPLLESTKAEQSVAVFVSTQPCASALAKAHSTSIEQTCIAHGRKFLSVNLYESGSPAPQTRGAQHLAYAVQEGITVSAVAKDVLKWLCAFNVQLSFRLRANICIVETLAPIETLHLISENELKAVDDKNFPSYTYCPLGEARLRRKDDLVQFVAVIISKPVVDPAGNKVTWSVADKTGVVSLPSPNPSSTIP